MEITHLPEDNLFKTVVDGYTAYVTYIIRDGKLDIRHTIVPPEIGSADFCGSLCGRYLGSFGACSWRVCDNFYK